jgi:predicted transcriptional regulator
MDDSDLHQIEKFIRATRARAISYGDYIGAITDYESLIKKIARCQAQYACDDNIFDKLERLQEKVHQELRILNELSKELITFPQAGAVTKRDLEDLDGNIPNALDDLSDNQSNVNKNLRGNSPISNKFSNNQQQILGRKVPVPSPGAIASSKKAIEDVGKLERIRRERDNIAVASNRGNRR